jgi:hypothetical protein
MNALRQAENSKEFEVQIFKRLNDKKKEQFLILLGETHFQDEKTSKIGLEVIKHFKTIGIEGMHASTSDGAKISELEVWGSLIYDFERLKQEASKNRSIPGTIKQVSAIDSEQFKNNSEENKYLRSIMDGFNRNPQYPENLLPHGIKLNQLGEKAYKAFHSLGLPDDFELSAESFRSVVQRIRETVYKDKIEIFSIEDVVSSELLSAADATEKACNALKVCCGLTAWSLLRLSMGLINSSASSGLDTCIYAATLASIPLMTLYLKRTFDPILPRCIALNAEPFDMRPLTETRDPIMADRISHNMNIRSDLDDFLVIVGKAHIKEVKELLLEKYGFQDVSYREP